YSFGWNQGRDTIAGLRDHRFLTTEWKKLLGA
ncbi:MAG: hypothetical protein ACI841_002710, partial [Planctomycetota bacterium]